MGDRGTLRMLHRVGLRPARGSKRKEKKITPKEVDRRKHEVKRRPRRRDNQSDQVREALDRVSLRENYSMKHGMK